MFPWNFARSAETLFSRWAIKRVCKFLLKKKLGKFILGDIDLNQLDVQLSAGTIQLSDLALNVDYLNQKFGSTAAVYVQEGSIGSLLVTMPWKGDGCRIEVDELELVLAPDANFSQSTLGNCLSTESSVNQNLGNRNDDNVDEAGAKTNAFDVHEGVKTIAKMVKWLLTSFHVEVRKLIIAFDPCLGEEKRTGLCKTLVLRVTEVECGTCISEGASLDCEAVDDNFLGLTQMTNFIKFSGAVLEFLQIDEIVDKKPNPCTSGTITAEWSSCSPNVTTPIITGERGGLAGNLKLTIPWRNGSLDICKVEADASIDPLVIKLQPSSIRCLIYLWGIFKDMGEKKDTEFSPCDSVVTCDSTRADTSMLNMDEVLPGSKAFSAEHAFNSEPVREALLSESCLISDWVSRSRKINNEEEPDFGESVHQFFECFDDLRNSQSALGSSGMWNWTCSVFSAITAASNLASGSLLIPSDQQHLETNLRATVAKVSLLFSFIDEEERHCCSVDADKGDAGFCVHYVSANFQDLLLLLQVRRQEMNFEATVQHMQLTDHFSRKDDTVDFKLRIYNDIKVIQDAVQTALPPLDWSTNTVDLDNQNASAAPNPLGMNFTDGFTHPRNKISMFADDVVQVELLKTFGACLCQATKSSSGNSFVGPTSFSLKLPPFIFWVNFDLLSETSELFKKIMDPIEMTGTLAREHRHMDSSKGIGRTRPCSGTRRISEQESFRGTVSLPTARIILSFPCGNDDGFKSYYSWQQFISLDVSSPSIPGEKASHATKKSAATSSKSRNSVATLCSLYLNFGKLDVNLITSLSGENAEITSGSASKYRLLAQKIMTTSNGRGPSVVTFSWQDSARTSPWIMKRAKQLACSDNARCLEKFRRKGYEFSSVTAVKGSEDFNGNVREEMIISSGFCIHAHLSPVTIALSKSEFVKLNDLLSQVIDRLSGLDLVPLDTEEVSSSSQSSVLVECDSITILSNAEVVENNNKGSLQNEITGSWHSFRLELLNFGLLSVLDIGGTNGASFLWVTHGEGNLWGSITGVPGEEFLLISISDSSSSRGDGEGSNVLSAKLSGSDIIHFHDPRSSSMSITIRCGTIVAVGGRLDWFDTIFSLFAAPSPETKQECDSNVQKEDCETSVPFESSFILSLIDIALSYEPYLNKLMIHGCADSQSSSPNCEEAIAEQYVACLLAASSLRLSSTTVADSAISSYKITVQDLGLLLSAMRAPNCAGSVYSVEHLRKIGYVKVAQQADVEALLRISSDNGGLWEIGCSESQIVLNTCHDTASGLTRLAAQLQQLFAPDLEESVVHLQTRWNNVQQAREGKEFSTFDVDSVSSTSDMQAMTGDVSSEGGNINLMDEICEDAFQLDHGEDGQADYPESPIDLSPNNSFIGETFYYSNEDSPRFLNSSPVTGSVPVVGQETSETSLSPEQLPQLIEEYFLSDLCPLSELTLTDQSSKDNLRYTPSPMRSGDDLRENTGWYGDNSLRILDNHVSEVNRKAGSLELTESEASSILSEPDENKNVKGRIVLNNMNIIWRLYAGSDWQNVQNNAQQSTGTCGRDTTVCLELTLSGVRFQYDIFPDGGTWVSRQSITVHDFCVKDNSNAAPWKLVLGYYQSKGCLRKSSSKAFKLDLEAVRPDPAIPLEEYRLRIALLPMRLHLHQNQLDFLISFFGGTQSAVTPSQSTSQSLSKSDIVARRTEVGGDAVIEEALLPYFQKFDIWPVHLRVDYSPCHVDLAALRGGKYVELVNLVPWKGVDLHLKHVQALGVYGWSGVCEIIIGEWLEDISQNQIHKLLKGLPPIRSLVAVGSSAAKLVSLPVKSYKKDQKLLKGMQRGTIAFLRSISLEAIGLGVHLAAGAHEILLQAEYILTSVPPSVPWPVQSGGNTSVRFNQPRDARQGIQQAYESMSDGFSKSASALIRAPMKRYQRGAGMGSALATAVQAAPAAAIAPASATARAVHCALLGVRNSLNPERKKESLEKYLGTSPPQQYM
ncbi:PREDICTED: autophagy-related protein 2 isoform X1 [Nicotiana attenuata]|uniref:Autophagy-related protein 2 n=1 Tax=Nicotiana attenuata TaxID=49451 RepID=A0A1J6HU07_NICAT|nr:PREDICTED: autophagy-related protein 2 isoform X1 [Nicotiana attenuata]XP_019257397.1 PREDICTED: autophagy-related protein 2 isoform X1 [Nicotiana attenuata]OIS96357.1 autophagy-related protein 2 [Nicotiana attenuata]